MLILIYLAFRRHNPGVAVVMAVSFLFMKPALVLVSLTMSVCWMITLCSMIVMLIYHDRLEEKNMYPELFCMIGIMVAYFDFLTYPVVTLGLPICAYFLIERKMGIKSRLMKVLGYSICWGTGYAGMWAMKWIIADLTLHTGTIRDAAWSIIGRTESIGGRARLNGGNYVIGLNLQEYGLNIYFVAVIIMLILAFVAMITALKYMKPGQIAAELLTFAIIFMVPFVWIIVVQHHSALHARFTFRILSVSVAAVCSLGISLFKEVKNNIRIQKN
jgi:hypothetical protein